MVNLHLLHTPSILCVVITISSLLLLPHQSFAKYQDNSITVPKNIYGRRLVKSLARTISANDRTKNEASMSDTKFSASDKEDHSDGTDEKHSRAIFGYILLCMFVLISTLLVWIFRKSISTFCKRLWIKFRHSGMQVIWRRRSNQQLDGTLNDIIFDPGEENSSNLTDSLLGS